MLLDSTSREQSNQGVFSAKMKRGNDVTFLRRKATVRDKEEKASGTDLEEKSKLVKETEVVC